MSEGECGAKKPRAAPFDRSFYASPAPAQKPWANAKADTQVENGLAQEIMMLLIIRFDGRRCCCRKTPAAAGSAVRCDSLPTNRSPEA